MPYATLCLLWMAALLLGCQSSPRLPAESQSLNGHWRFQPQIAVDAAPAQPEFDDSHWPEIRVPGNWSSQGFDTQGAHWYRTRFQWQPQSQSAGQRLWFEGVDYQAEVWLNGQYLGQHRGYFGAFYFDVDTELKPGANLLAVRVDSPLESQQGDSWSLHKTLIKGVLGHHDTRAGGAWSDRGQERNTGGIWGRVWLQPQGEVRLNSQRWHSQIDADLSRGQWQLSYLSEQQHLGEWQLSLTPVNFQGQAETWRQPGQLPAGDGQVTLLIPEAKRPLWWPRERGAPNLYRLQARFVSDGQTLLHSQQTVGFRSIDYDGQLGRWSVNGQPLFLRGTNYIAHQFLSQADDSLLLQDLQLMQQAHINVVRVHAHLLPQRFYDLANRMGMLVWQDFPLQWGYQDSDAFHRDAQRQLAEMVAQFHHHPSIITWSAHNEPPWDADWMRYRYQDYHPKQNEQLDLALYQSLRRLDPHRPSFALSRTAEHPWYGWYSGHWTDYGAPAKEKLITEFGAQALPDAPVLYQLLQAPADWPALPDDWSQWQYHNFQPHETFELAGIEPGPNVLSLIDNTQRYQQTLTRFAAESYRRQKYQPVGAIFQFMFVEHWPSMNWGIVDYRRNPKPGYQALKQAYQPLLPSIMHHRDRFSRHEPVPLPVVIINDHLHTLPGSQLTLTLHQGDVVVDHRQQQLHIQPDSVLALAPFPNRLLTPGRYLARATLHDDHGRHLASSQFTFEVQP
ncbi:glycoside hydrolase family 2 protein [Ferrimonas sp. SCSIO 43195]|uniref:glycoside hydrolase family 2 protein n=1 Tax=Ferrimonas sp. SCSIO 43195 TaxID=2822844 RepID=UPI00207605CF|nr:sugar-binding domain-containing protein [Ferrimonas sp. SCSIO 43195]USD38077.1 beta galactosidase jelly roll domain-containing protein [Ferrimonas sp. SCSIO 43195]